MGNGNGNDKKTTPLKKVVSAVAKLSPWGKAYAARAEIAETGQSGAEPKRSVVFIDEKTLDYSSFGSEGVEDQPMVAPMNKTNPEDTPVSNRAVVAGLHRRKHSMEDIHNALEIPLADVEQALYDGVPGEKIPFNKFQMASAEKVEIGSDGNLGRLVSSRPGSATLDSDEFDELAKSLEKKIESKDDTKPDDDDWDNDEGI
ncbi:MAG: hypothetical protein ABSB19_20430 [Methylomonas sp.]|jgi:hypothetical protein